MQNKLEQMILRGKPAHILLAVYQLDKPYISTIAKEVNTTFAHATNVLADLEAQGLLVFEKKGRIKYAKLTSHGKSIAEAMEKLMSTMSKEPSEKKDKKQRHFILLSEKDKKIGTYSGRQPRQAALKAARRGYKEIRLRESGTKKIHVYKGEREKLPAPESRPDWMPGKIWQAKVRKMGMEKQEG